MSLASVLLFVCLVVVVVVVVVNAATTTTNNNNLEVYDDYVLLASQVQDWSRASSVFVIFAGNDESLAAMSLMLRLVREFSKKDVLSLAANYKEFHKSCRFYHKRIVRPLIVVLLSSDDDVANFRETARAYDDISYPQWLLVFVEANELCRAPPNDNIFNLRFDTLMLVKCYGESTVREWYSVNDRETTTYDLAKWNPVMGFQLTTNMTLYERRHSLGGKVFRVATFMESPFVTSQAHPKSKGLFHKIMVELSRSLNFTFDVSHKETAYGILDPANGTWSGIIGRIVDGQVDIGVAEMTLTVQRMRVLDFTLPLFLSRNRLYMRRPGGSVVQWDSYSSAFRYDIWVVLGTTQLLAVILVTVIRLNVEGRAIPAGHLSENYLTVWGSFCQQGLADFPTATSLRIAYISLFMLSVVITAIYSACLISYLTLTVPSLPFADLEGFVRAGTHRLVTYLGSADHTMFTYATDPTLMRMRQLMRDKSELPSTVMGGFRMVCEQPDSAFHSTEAVKDQLNDLLTCDLAYIDTGRFDSLGMVLTKGSPYAGVINYHLQKFKDCGIMTRLKRYYFTGHGSSGGSGGGGSSGTNNEYQPVSLRGIVPLIVVLLVGVATSLLVFASELIVYGFDRSSLLRRKQKRDARSCGAAKVSLLTLCDKFVKRY